MAARCEAAGRPNSKNEDNFQLGNNLSDGKWCFIGDEVITLGDKGALLVVCDGMGGMNAGEKASEIAVNTIKTWFMPDQLGYDVTASPEAIKRHIEKAIIAADAKIKEEARADKSKEGMGSTIVLAWLVGDNVYVGWCGDSRAYRFNPASGLEPLSKDHSYVQELVDAKKLTEDLAFDHPNNNIITRSLGDPRQKARPDVKCFPLNNGDIILLCSDGLCGVLRNSEIEAIVANHAGSMNDCLNALWYGAQNAGWHDNVTIALCQILSGAKTSIEVPVWKQAPKYAPEKPKKSNWVITTIVAFIMLTLGLAAGYYFSTCHKPTDKDRVHLRSEIDRLFNRYIEVDSAYKDIGNYRSSIIRWHESLLLPDDSISDERWNMIHTEYSKFDTDTLDNLYEQRRAELEKKIKENGIQENEIPGLNVTQLFIPADVEKAIKKAIEKKKEKEKEKEKKKEKNEGQKFSTTPEEIIQTNVQLITDPMDNKKYPIVEKDGTKYVEYTVPAGRGWTEVLQFATRCEIYPTNKDLDSFIKEVCICNELDPEDYKGEPAKKALQVDQKLLIPYPLGLNRI
jgi:serine/threonine protein phosphatase PrpC